LALVKLTIIPFADPEPILGGPPAGPPFVAQFNPESFSVETEFEYAKKEPSDGSSGESAQYQHTAPRKLSFDLLLDGTNADGAVPRGAEALLDVTARLELFKRTVAFNGAKHRPNFLLVSWGLFLATCVLESYTIDYKMFRPNGTPLRAVLSLKLREHMSDQSRKLTENKSSPDVQHLHSVIAGDRLDLLAHEYYGDARLHVRVAEANGLDNVRSVRGRPSIFFPRLI
jgi:hypothetical protein